MVRYRCIHPLDGPCPTEIERGRREDDARVEQVEVVDLPPVQLDRRREEEREVDMEIEACQDQRTVMRQEKDDAKEKLQQLIGTADRGVASSR